MKKPLSSLIWPVILNKVFFGGLFICQGCLCLTGTPANASPPQKQEQIFKITLVPKEITFFRKGSPPVIVRDTALSLSPGYSLVNSVVDTSSMTAFLFVQKDGKKKAKGLPKLYAWDILRKSVLWDRAIEGREGYLAGDLIVLPNSPAMGIEKKSGHVRWSRNESIRFPLVSHNVGFCQSISAVDLQNGMTRWTREIENYGGYFERVITDSLMILSVDGLRVFNLLTGKGWDIRLPTWEEDQSNVVANRVLGAPFTASGRNWMGPEKPDVYSGLLSNILVVENRVFFTAKDYMACLDLFSGKKIWHTRLPEEKAGSIFLFRMDGNVGLINRGFCWFNNTVIKYLYPYFLAVDEKNGNFLCSKAIKSMNIVNDYVVADSSVFILTEKEILKYSKRCQYCNSISMDKDASIHSRFGEFISFIRDASPYYIITDNEDSCSCLKNLITNDMFAVMTKNGIVLYDGLLKEMGWYPLHNVFIAENKTGGHLFLKPMKKPLSKRIVVADNDKPEILGHIDLPGIKLILGNVMMYSPDLYSICFMNCSRLFQK